MRDAGCEMRIKLNERGFTLAGALTIIAILAIFWVLTLPLWQRVKQRDNEEELIFRGTEYTEAIARYHQKFGTYPPDPETLLKLKYIRKLYLDPMTKSGKWKVLHPDALLQTGAAGEINKPGGKKNKKGLNQGDDEDDEEEDEDEESNKLPGLTDEDEDKDEEKEVESIGPVVGVVSRSKKSSIKIYNGQEKYNSWKFIYALQQQQQGQPVPGVNPPGSKSGGKKNPPIPSPQPDPNDDDEL